MRIVGRALAKGYTVSVYDGEEFPVKRSTNRAVIRDALASTDEDILVIRESDGTRVGNILLVWGNSPEEVAADYSDFPAIREIVEVAD